MRSHASLALGLAMLMLMSAQSGVFMAQDAESEELYDFRVMESSVRTTNLVDVPSWKINDIWNYDGALDVRDFVAAADVSTNVQFLDGTMTQRVASISMMDVAGVDTLVYRVESDGYYEAEGINLDGYSGDLVVQMDTEEYFRVSDLASIQYEATFDIDFIIAQIVIIQTIVGGIKDFCLTRRQNFLLQRKLADNFAAFLISEERNVGDFDLVE